MSRLLPYWLAAVFLVLAAFVPVSSTASVPGSDYVRVGVPAMPQAVQFFRDVLNCELLDPVRPGISNDPQRSRSRPVLLLCDTGSVVELFEDRGRSALSSSPSQAARGQAVPVRLHSANIAHADRWLQRAGVEVTGVTASSPDTGETVVSFVAPWGARLQLVGWSRGDVAITP